MGRNSLTIDSQLIDNWLPIDWQLYSTSVKTVQYKCADCKVQVAKVGQKISGPKNI